MIVTGKALARRTFLRGVGGAVALPFLDAMRARPWRPADKTGSAPLRLLFVYVPIGAEMDNWTPKEEGGDFEFSRILKPLEPYRSTVSVLTGLDSRNGNALGDGAGDHARAGRGLPHRSASEEDRRHRHPMRDFGRPDRRQGGGRADPVSRR